MDSCVVSVSVKIASSDDCYNHNVRLIPQVVVVVDKVDFALPLHQRYGKQNEFRFHEDLLFPSTDFCQISSPSLHHGKGGGGKRRVAASRHHRQQPSKAREKNREY